MTEPETGIGRRLAELAAQIHSMTVAVDALRRQLAESEAILLRLVAEYRDSGGEVPPEQRGS